MIITNTGTVSAGFTLSATSLVNTPATPKLSDVLTLKVEDITGTPTTLYQGSVSGFSAVSLGTFAAAAARSYRLTLAYPAGTDNAALQGATVALGLQIAGVSS